MQQQSLSSRGPRAPPRPPFPDSRAALTFALLPSTAGVPLTTFQALNVLLRADPTVKYEPVGGGGNRFFGMDGRVDLPAGAVVGKGFFQSVRPGNGGPRFVNLGAFSSSSSSSSPHQDDD